MVEFLFLDLDDTILDFHKAERIALGKTIRSFGVEPTDEILARYHLINKAQWERLERGETTRAEVLVDRFAVLFQELGIRVDPTACAKSYEKNLAIGHYFLPGAEEAVKSLNREYRLYLASNGTASVQHGRLTSAGLYPYFEQVFISEEIGFNKPSREYFQACFAKIPDFDPARAVMVGDSLTSDILGGKNAGLPTVWVNPEGKKCGSIRPDYTIKSVSELEGLLKEL